MLGTRERDTKTFYFFWKSSTDFCYLSHAKRAPINCVQRIRVPSKKCCSTQKMHSVPSHSDGLCYQLSSSIITRMCSGGRRDSISGLLSSKKVQIWPILLRSRRKRNNSLVILRDGGKHSKDPSTRNKKSVFPEKRSLRFRYGSRAAKYISIITSISPKFVPV